MAIAFRGVGATASGNSPASLTFAAPAGTLSTDLVLVVVFIGQAATTDATPTITPPSGWTQAVAVNNISTSTLYGTVYWGLGSASFAAWTFSGITEAAMGWAQGYTGVDNGTPMDATAVGQANAASNTATTPSITTVTANAWLVGFFMENGGSAGIVWSAEFGTHRNNDFFTDSFTATNALDSCDAAQAVAGASGTKSATFSGVAAASIGILTALRPASVVVLALSDDSIDCFHLPFLPSYAVSAISYDENSFNSSSVAGEGDFSGFYIANVNFNFEETNSNVFTFFSNTDDENDFFKTIPVWIYHEDDPSGFVPLPPLAQPSFDEDLNKFISGWFTYEDDASGFFTTVGPQPPSGESSLFIGLPQDVGESIGFYPSVGGRWFS